ncbi:unnamed protein product [Bursaphelenchus xylophilus]|uniref:(pine wood nematode) hypothetical protein n=1 Tax=Bursaphelenchus xylophilus TaxID=6326 RepID=A0A1I7RMG2_BURXY|nr:unnamed protein product [Bursaphelenchus xylophilus]CAG9118459.1 unnamed protein product [Bursaphelenchus xylophilus]
MTVLPLVFILLEVIGVLAFVIGGLCSKRKKENTAPPKKPEPIKKVEPNKDPKPAKSMVKPPEKEKSKTERKPPVEDTADNDGEEKYDDIEVGGN